MLDAAGSKPVVFRTLDIGGDKALPYLSTEDEEAENPSPVRGLTYTFDSEVSQLLTSGTAVTKVTVHHGAAAESLAFD